jgi:hypothetical protein
MEISLLRGKAANMSKKMLTVLSEWGYWGEELIGPPDIKSI